MEAVGNKWEYKDYTFSLFPSFGLSFFWLFKRERVFRPTSFVVQMRRAKSSTASA